MTDAGTHRFPVEATHLLFYARSIGDPLADDTDYTSAIAPPTFTAAHVQYLPGYPLRPVPGVPWMGSGRGASGASADGFGASFHAEQVFEYHRPVRAGMILNVQTKPGSSWTKARHAGGHLAFEETVTTLRDHPAGSLVQTIRQVAVRICPDTSADSAAPGQSAEVAVESPVATAHGQSAASALAIGTTRELPVIEGLTRSQLVMYSGASGDYNPLHTDEPFATQIAGYPSVFAHGMFTMGASARVITEWLGTESLLSYGAQFRGQVWPGDSLTVSASIERHTAAGTFIGLTTRTQDDRIVMTGVAVVK
jgi:peroxisomal enoyl-CoA hydratase 2